MKGRLNILNENKNNNAVDITNELNEFGTNNLYVILNAPAPSNLAASTTALSIFINPAR
ncbi:MAG: hypothetical protein MjAS7_2220 [Metallosphaera javensis (ex Sakai et al. 2022)]|nr:MAG: hypothetical protein MjAS7_2220 [Metallosphaera javensis (ex Sakai et al. 2022)]